MLSVAELRAILRRPDLNDEQVARIRDDLHCFARTCIEAYLRERRQSSSHKR